MRSFHNTLESIQEDMGIVPVVEPPFQFLQITIHVLDAHLVERAHYGTLEQAQYAFNGVSVDIAYHPLLVCVSDRLVMCIVIFNAQLGLQLIRVISFRIILDRSSNESMQGLTCHVRDAFYPDLSAALNCSGNDRLVSHITPSLALCLSAYDEFHQLRQRQGE